MIQRESQLQQEELEEERQVSQDQHQQVEEVPQDDDRSIEGADSESVGSTLSEGKFEVQFISGHKRQGEGGGLPRLYFLVKWEGYDEESWEPVEALKGCKDKVREYLSQQGTERWAGGRVRSSWLDEE